MRTIKILISGLVQGIFFKNYIKEEAIKLGLKGYVRSLENGKVEVVVEGKDEEVDTMRLVCKKGSMHSEVKKIELQDMNHVGFKEFKIMNI